MISSRRRLRQVKEGTSISRDQRFERPEDLGKKAADLDLCFTL